MDATSQPSDGRLLWSPDTFPSTRTELELPSCQPSSLSPESTPSCPASRLACIVNQGGAIDFIDLQKCLPSL